MIVDCSVVEGFAIPHISGVPDRDSFLVTFYRTELSVSEILEKLNVDDMKFKYSFYGKDTILVTKDLFEFLESKVPYLISMVSSDFSRISFEEINVESSKDEVNIPNPLNEPTIGVIDTLFDESVYFSNWVENTDYLDDIERMMETDDNRDHGTAVSSIIVDGPRLNPWLDDGYGR